MGTSQSVSPKRSLFSVSPPSSSHHYTSPSSLLPQTHPDSPLPFFVFIALADSVTLPSHLFVQARNLSVILDCSVFLITLQIQSLTQSWDVCISKEKYIHPWPHCPLSEFTLWSREVSPPVSHPCLLRSTLHAVHCAAFQKTSDAPLRPTAALSHMASVSNSLRV